MRKPFLAGNWKMNLDREGALALAQAIRDHVADRDDVDVAVFPPFVYLADVVRALDGSSVRVGTQNMHEAASGAFTGEISGPMLRDVGATMVILGHSERRHVFLESDEGINSKTIAALELGRGPRVVGRECFECDFA